MADNIEVTPGTGTTVAADEVGGALYQRVKIAVGADGSATDVSSAAPMPVTGPITDDELRAADVAVTLDGESVAVTGPLTDDELRAADVKVSLDGETVVLAAGTNNIGDVDIATIAAGDNNIGNVDVASIAAGETLIGLVGASDIVVTVTPTCDTNAYSSGDLLFDSTEVANAVRANGYSAILQSITIIDKGDQGVAFTLLVANAATDFGTLNSAPDPDDTESATVIGWVPVATGDYVDLGANKVACIRNIGLLCKAGASTTSLYIAAMNGTGTPTFGASDLVFQLGFLRS